MFKQTTMSKKILVTSTWDSNYTLLTFFINFYNLYWENPTFLFICGYQKSEEEVLAKFQNYKNINFKKKIFIFNYNDKFASNFKLYNSGKYYLITYKTLKNKKSFDWLRLRKNLFDKIFKKNIFKNFDYYLNTDNDDFFYVKNLQEYLVNYEKKPEEFDYFHSLEFIPVEKYSKNSNFFFISHPYFYIHKSRGGMSVANRHMYCRKLNLDNKFMNEVHVEINNLEKTNCYNFENNFHNFKQIDRVCFAIGCVDLDYLVESKKFIQATTNKDKKERFEQTALEIQDKFFKYYLPNNEEIKSSKVFDLEEFKKFFDTYKL